MWRQIEVNEFHIPKVANVEQMENMEQEVEDIGEQMENSISLA